MVESGLKWSHVNWYSSVWRKWYNFQWYKSNGPWWCRSSDGSPSRPKSCSVERNGCEVWREFALSQDIVKDIACRFLDQEAAVMGGLTVRESIGLATLVPGPLLLLVIVTVIGPRSVAVIGYCYCSYCYWSQVRFSSDYITGSDEEINQEEISLG